MATVTGVKVVDASALAALLFAEPDAETIVKQMEGARLAAPALLYFELANVCAIKIRRHPNQRDALRAAFHLVHRFPVEIVAVDFDATLDLAQASGLTAYDASYLCLARKLGAALITLDRQLAAAAR